MLFSIQENDTTCPLSVGRIFSSFSTSIIDFCQSNNTDTCISRNECLSEYAPGFWDSDYRMEYT